MLKDHEVGVLRRTVRRILRRIVSRFDEETERVIWLMLGAAIKRHMLTTAVVAGNFLAAIFEGGSLGILALAVAVITDPSGTQSFDKLGSVGRLISPWLGSYSREEAFLMLVSIAMASQVVKAGLQFGSSAASIFLTSSTRLEMQKTLIRHINSMTYEEVGRYPAGGFAAYMSSSGTVANLLLTINQFILNLMLCAAYVVLMFWISWKIALAALVVVGVFSATASLVIERVRQLGKRFARLSIRLGQDTMQYLQAPRLIRIFNKEDQVIDHWAEIVGEQTLVKRKADLLQSVLGPAMDTLTVILSGVIIIGGYYLFRGTQGHILPVLLSFIIVLTRMMSRISALSKMGSSVSNIMPSAQLLAEILRTDNKEMEDTGGLEVTPIRECISVHNLGFRYRGQSAPTLRGVTFDVPRGESVAIVGSSGAGKTTLLDLILGLYRPTEGDVEIDGVKLRDANVFSWRRQFCVVDQDPFFFNRSVRDNLLFIKPDADEELIRAALKRAYIDDFIFSLPEGLDTIIGERGQRLSGGQLQRLAVARAFLADADIVVFDEATSALDSVSELYIKKAMREMKGRKTLLVVAHRLSTVVDSDNIIVLRDGGICGRGRHRELLLTCPDYKELWDVQTNADVSSLDA